MTLLDISSLTLDLPNGKRLLDGISIQVAAGETIGLVGESGSGKSLTARSVIGLLPRDARMGGSITIDGHDFLNAGKSELRSGSASGVRRRRRAASRSSCCGPFACRARRSTSTSSRTSSRAACCSA